MEQWEFWNSGGGGAFLCKVCIQINLIMNEQNSKFLFWGWYIGIFPGLKYFPNPHLI